MMAPLPALQKIPTPLALLAFRCTKTTSASMTSITTSASKTASAQPHPSLSLLTNTECPSEGKALPNALRVKAKGHRGKHDGPFQLRFITATNPSQFKNGTTRYSIRSHAMRNYKKTPNKEQTTSIKRPETVPLYAGPLVAEQAWPANTRAQSFTPNSVSSVSGVLGRYVHRWRPGTHVLRGKKSAIVAPGAQPRKALFEGDQSPQSGRNKRFRRPQSRTCAQPVDYEYTESQQERKIRLLVTTFCRIGDGVDPFNVLPQFESPELNSVFLLRHCMRAFATEAYVKQWVAGMLPHPDTLLSTVFLASNWLDMLAKLPGESIRTRLVRDEIMGMLNKRLQHVNKDNAASTLVIILHLMAGEMWSCNEETVRRHVSGIAQLITLCGGMGRLGKRMIAEVSTACCFQCDLVYEARPLSTFASWQLPEYTAGDDDDAILESPLFCPRPDFVTVLNDERCSPSTWDLLRDMRDLTNLFLSRNATTKVCGDIVIEPAAFPCSADFDYNAKVTEIRDRLANLPPAGIAGHAGSGDWVYEACRLTAIIYTASIICSLPFSIAADPSQNPFCTGEEALEEPQNNQILLATNLSETLWEALERTDLANVWNGMAGVLYWICTVGAAAARAPTAFNMSQQLSYCRPCKLWVRQCITMFSVRAMVVLVFKHPVPILMSQKRLLRVQELVGTYGLIM